MSKPIEYSEDQMGDIELVADFLHSPEKLALKKGIPIELMKTKTFDKKFDDNEDLSDVLDVSKSRRPNQEQRRVMEIKTLKTEADYEAALARISVLMDAKKNTPEGDELDVLARLVENYESIHHGIGPPIDY